MLSLMHKPQTDRSNGQVAQLEPGIQRRPSTRAVSHAELLRNLTLRLQTSLELDRLLQFFLDELRTFIAVKGLHYRHADTGFDLMLGDSGDVRLQSSLSHQGDCLGELILFGIDDLTELSTEQLESAVSCTLFPLRNALLYRRAIQASLKDSLTGAGNRAALEQSLNREIELSRRHGLTMSIVMLDMDHFKILNDTYGHQAGDAALRATALLLKEQLRNVDMVFRYGGEEFILVLSNTDSDAASIVGERIRAAIECLPFLVGERQVRLSASLGCATYKPHESQHDLMRRADKALYAAKRDGRNRLQMASV